MRYSPLTHRLQGLGGAKWEIHHLARSLKAEGREVIELTIGEPDVPCPPALVAATTAAMQAGRTGYSNGHGEPAALAALAARYTARRGRVFGPENVMTLPGTQTALFAVLCTLLGSGDEVIVADPMYATYEGLIAATGATAVPVALRPEAGFRLQAADVAPKISAKTRVLFLNSPHNPTGAVLRAAEIAALGALARAHDLWIVADEVYEDLIFDGVPFSSPLDFPELADRTVVTSSISKSHAAPGFRSGWCVGPQAFCNRMLPLSETMLFGSQPFIADMTALAITEGSPVARGMAERFARRAALIHARLHGKAGLAVHRPEAGMFALLDIRSTGMSGEAFARALLLQSGVACMPGESFGTGLAGWLRLSLTQPDGVLETACTRIAAFAAEPKGEAA
ncbi:pyridoxal phosphate-dependent aminotransferase [Tabrizicola oligotrophica]|uniref:aspartate transaminase n=1 Tax=Tabrizicola oligotrophica TaxID=2710650 RepID=A0A6M0QTY1_9RHOB|nr:pyridoxal phosphate-dependent aminotransferase [Tabrizicola oligotrophica]NEY90451.1 pyridoxal phosphate-dependent aminotransferase [Tabrizicola oligotrophica]